MTLTQSVINFEKNDTLFFNANQSTQSYINGLLSTIGKKNVASMARESGYDVEELACALKKENTDLAEIESYLVRLVNTLATPQNKGILAFDFTFIEKMFAAIMEQLSWDYNGVGKRIDQGFSMGFAFWLDPINKLSIPLTNEVWLNRKVAQDRYLSKIEIAKIVIMRLKDIIPFDLILLDGAFAYLSMIDFLEEHKLKFIMRVAKNRVVTNDTATASLLNHPDLILHKNRKYTKCKNKTAAGCIRINKICRCRKKQNTCFQH